MDKNTVANTTVEKLFLSSQSIIPAAIVMLAKSKEFLFTVTESTQARMDDTFMKENGETKSSMEREL